MATYRTPHALAVEGDRQDNGNRRELRRGHRHRAQLTPLEAELQRADGDEAQDAGTDGVVQPRSSGEKPVAASDADRSEQCEASGPLQDDGRKSGSLRDLTHQGERDAERNTAAQTEQRPRADAPDTSRCVRGEDQRRHTETHPE